MKKTRVKLDSENSLLDCLTQKVKVKYFMRGRVNCKRQKCSFLVMATFLDFQGF